jgi:hypothetical protein
VRGFLDRRTPEPTAADLDGLIAQIEREWTATVTVRRQARDDIGYREIYVVLDGHPIGMLRNGEAITHDIPPGRHRLLVHNTLFRRVTAFDARVGDHVRFQAVNRPGWATYSPLAIFVGFLGAGPIHLSLSREADAGTPLAPGSPDC